MLPYERDVSQPTPSSTGSRFKYLPIIDAVLGNDSKALHNSTCPQTHSIWHFPTTKCLGANEFISVLPHCWLSLHKSMQNRGKENIYPLLPQISPKILSIWPPMRFQVCPFYPSSPVRPLLHPSQCCHIEHRLPISLLQIGTEDSLGFK